MVLDFAVDTPTIFMFDLSRLAMAKAFEDVSRNLVGNSGCLSLGFVSIGFLFVQANSAATSSVNDHFFHSGSILTRFPRMPDNLFKVSLSLCRVTSCNTAQFKY